MLKNILYEFRKVLYHKEIYIALVIAVALAVLGTTEQLFIYKGTDLSTLKPAFRLSMINSTTVGDIVIVYLIPIITAIAYGDSYLTEYSYGVDILQIYRSSRIKYFLSKAAVIALMSFIIIVLMFIINEILCLIAFPAFNHVSYYGELYIGNPYPDTFIDSAMFRGLFLNAPYLNNLVHIIMTGIWGALLGLLTFCISLFVKKSRLIIVCTTTILMSLYSFTMGNILNKLLINNYLFSAPITEKLFLSTYIIICLLLLLFCIICIFVKSKCRKFKDILR